ncbi:putative flagellin with Flp1-like domain [Ruminiclostridium sufflavum DSM 19573]|uniref:Putative flagellin with Flp1-like domain n=1 Tax=Ruminiclostridium sufflavum DSM 19573 TaxID=1121337 RepID=A0A318XM59_9FIRM|nr:Flp1 family type IVb pilin [Ruminiclostridium sufflavum]PYG88517.1 putative flagellin with Flp1-like domain [Ruminiclostridium sufflavum DSM 19573]
MLNTLKRFAAEEDGMGTVEIVIIIAVLVGVALLFRNQLIKFVNSIIENLFPDGNQLENNTGTQAKLNGAD